MTFDTFLSLLVEYTEDRALIMRRQSEAMTLFVYQAKIPFSAAMIQDIDAREARRVNNPRGNH